MLTTMRTWLITKWRLMHTDQTLAAFPIAFGTLHGQLVLQYLLDNIYCTVYEGKDPVEMAYHAGQRSVVQVILENIDRAQQPAKYHLMEARQNGLTS